MFYFCPMDYKAEYERLTKELKEVFERISDYYKKMSKTNDKGRLDSIQSAIDQEVNLSKGLRNKLEQAKRDYYKWTTDRNLGE